MKIITNYLFKVRRKAILSDLKLLSWKAYTTILFFFLFALIIENIFYLSIKIRTGVLIILFSILLIFFIWLSIVLLKIYYNSFKRYNLSNLAKKVGSLVFSKHDTLLNAFQIESSDNQISSKELREQFIARTIDKLNKISFTKIFPSKKIDQWKKITFISLLISGLIILSLWNSATSAMYRLSHPTTEFIPPKPFTIYSSTRHVNVLGGEDVNVTFFTSGVEVPDSLLIEFTPLMFNTNNDSMILIKAVVNNNNYSVS